jgi:hypothetical protein
LACPPHLNQYPASLQTESTTTKTFFVGTTVVPIRPTGPRTVKTEAFYTTEAITTLKCTKTVLDCPLTDRTPHKYPNHRHENCCLPFDDIHCLCDHDLCYRWLPTRC